MPCIDHNDTVGRRKIKDKRKKTKGKRKDKDKRGKTKG
jgi:hypothetical protein